MGTTLTIIAESRPLTSSVWTGEAVFHMGKVYEVMRAIREAAHSCRLVDVKALGARTHVKGWPPDYGATEAYAYAKTAEVDASYWVDEDTLFALSELELEPVQAFVIAMKSVRRCKLRFLCFER